MSGRRVEPPQFFETQFLLAYKKLLTLGVQRPGHLNLLEKTKVMGGISKKGRRLVRIEKSRRMTLSMRAVSFLRNRLPFLTLRRNLTLSRDFTPRHPLCPFHLTQIEMTGTFPIDSSICESRTLFLHCRCGA